MLAVYESEFHEIRHLDDDGRFKIDTDDTVWMTELAMDQPEWIIITRDLKIARNKEERALLNSVPMKFFFSLQTEGQDAAPRTHLEDHQDLA